MVNLIRDRWIPAIRKDRTEVCIAPWEVTRDHETNPVVHLRAPRADFNGALIQFLIGLMQTVIPPSTDRAWFKKFESPPDPDYLQGEFEKVAHAFEVDGDGARFMQDFDLAEGVETSIDHLLIEMPGKKTLEDNTDHFIKRDTVRQICPSCSAMALFTLQTNAPSGGSGHRTSLRGGGPLTTIVMGRTLWETVWLSVVPTDSFARYGNADLQGEADIFPWLAPTRTSESGGDTTPQDVNPAQMYWGMPRRVRLDCDGTTQGICDLCGCRSERLITSYRTKNLGVNYNGNWRHTLTAYSTNKTGDLLSQKGQPGGVSYRNWLGLVQNDAESKIEPAVVVHTFRYDRQPDLPEVPFRLWAFGYDMDNMKARCWYEGTMPLTRVDPIHRAEYEAVTAQLIRTASLVAFSTRTAIKKAIFSEKAEVRGDLSMIDARFWQDTEAEFYTTLHLLKDAIACGEDATAVKRRWLAVLGREAETLFEDFSQANLIGVADPKRIALARRDLRNFTSIRNKKIQKTLDIQPDNQPQR